MISLENSDVRVIRERNIADLLQAVILSSVLVNVGN